ncbi:MAG TPA: hypothetical protein VFH08_15265 [Chitinophagaceae bacterium]|nr:hypothetical protein [Chitinophagaceae bacterium]
MKKVMNSKTAIIVAIAAVFSTVFTNPVIAMGKKDDPGVEIKYLGFRESNPVFAINISKNETENFVITIRDASGTVLFSEKLTGRNISRTYRIDTEEEIEKGGLRFEVKSVSNNKTEVYVAGVDENIKREMAVHKIQ